MTVSEFIKQTGLRPIDSRILLEHVVGLSQSDIIAHPEKVLSDIQIEKLTEFAQQRKQGCPVEYIVGKKNFYKDCFTVFEGVLIPQPDTEILVEQAVNTALKSNSKTYRILDLCSGSGCIGISVAKDVASHFEDFEVVFADISDFAIKCTTINAENLLKNINYKIVKSNLFEKLSGMKFDLILTNPPYIASSVISSLESDVQHEPVLALDGGETGVELIQRLIDKVSDYLNPNGMVYMEIGYDQGLTVSNIFKDKNLKDVCVIKDLAGRDRVVKGRY